MPRLRDWCEASFGVNVFGYLTSIQSHGVLARTLVEVLRAQGVPLALSDVVPDFGGTGQDESVCAAGVDEASDQPYPVTIFCLPPADTQTFLERNPRLANRDRVTAVVAAVEHRVLRPESRPVLEAVDLVLTLSDFVAEAVSSGIPEATCVPFRQAISITGATPCKERWNVPSDTVLFVNSFDTYSDSCRKNPLALVRAFKEAFPAREDVALLLKIAHLEADDHLGGQAVLAVTETLGDPRIRILEEAMNYDEVLSLFATADVVVSLHRSEGLGLTLMEAMSVGTATMATSFSGNLEFMTEENSALVACDLVPVATPYPAYQYLLGRDVWADPSHQDSVAWLRRLADDGELREKLAGRAAADMRARHAVVMGGDVLVEIRRALLGEEVWARHDPARLRRLARPHGRLRLGVLRHRIAVRAKRLAAIYRQRGSSA